MENNCIVSFTVLLGLDLSQSKLEHSALIVKEKSSQNGAALDCNTAGKPGEGVEMQPEEPFLPLSSKINTSAKHL